jgi:cytochrome c oxidase subunit 1
MFKGKRAGANHWHATTLEWSATTSPPLGHGNFAVMPVVYRGPYEYSVPGYEAADYLPQNIPDEAPPPVETGGGMLAAGAVAQKES